MKQCLLRSNPSPITPNLSTGDWEGRGYTTTFHRGSTECRSIDVYVACFFCAYLGLVPFKMHSVQGGVVCMWQEAWEAQLKHHAPQTSKLSKCWRWPLLYPALARKEKKIMYAKVLHDYKPHGAGELRLYAGDTIKDITRLNKGWCKVRLYYFTQLKFWYYITFLCVSQSVSHACSQ